MRRDSGFAVAVSPLLAAERNRNALVLVLIADQLVANLMNSAKLANAPPPSPLRGGSSPSVSRPSIRVLRKKGRRIPALN
jgi:hypothetical protein